MLLLSTNCRTVSLSSTFEQRVPSPQSRFQVRTKSGLDLDATIDPLDPLLAHFYEDYDRAFVLPNEKETFEGFAECLALNGGDDYLRLRDLYGPFREFVAVIRQDGARVAGANFVVFPYASQGAHAGLTLNLNYVFVNSSHRRKGILRRLAHDLPMIARGLFIQTNGYDLAEELRSGRDDSVLMFIEQNDPFKMSPEDYARDTALTSIDQAERIRMWGRLGAKIVDFDYVQPPLSEEQEADETLAYAVLGAAGSSLSACILQGHLERFFGISVLKGGPLREEPSAARQLDLLDDLSRRGATLPLLQAARLPPFDPSARHKPASLRGALS